MYGKNSFYMEDNSKKKSAKKQPEVLNENTNISSWTEGNLNSTQCRKTFYMIYDNAILQSNCHRCPVFSNHMASKVLIYELIKLRLKINLHYMHNNVT